MRSFNALLARSRQSASRRMPPNRRSTAAAWPTKERPHGIATPAALTQKYPTMPWKLPQRFAVVRPWLRVRPGTAEWKVTLLDLLSFLSQPGMVQRGKKFIRAVTEEGDCNRLSLTVDCPEICYARQIPFSMLCMMISEQLNERDWHYYNVPETKVGPDDCVLDCGACEGLFTALSWRAKRILCIEPSRAFTGLLERSFSSLSHISVLNCALAEADGESRFVEDGASSRISETEGYPMSLRSVDSICQSQNVRPTYLKADLEGFEMSMLRGAQETIRECRPRIAITTYHQADHAWQIRELLARLNPRYKFRLKGITPAGSPVMLHAFE